MNAFFGPPGGDLEIPPSVYARMIDGDDGAFVLFDAAHSEDFDDFYRGSDGPIQEGAWRDNVEQARIYAIEINGLDGRQAARQWLSKHPIGDISEWVRMELTPDSDGEADVYDNIGGPPRRANVTLSAASPNLAAALSTATDLKPEIRPEADIASVLPSRKIEQVFVLDVGQGAANALVDTYGEVVAYVDLGRGVLKDIGTWPAGMKNICLLHDPKVVLTHWHYDHFHTANTFPNAQALTWIAPYQTLGPGPQSAMARAIIANGTLMVWNGGSTLSVGALELERCTGPAGNQNRTGIAVWVTGPRGEDPILLPGDAGYADFAMRTITSFVVAHHGGQAPGMPPARPAGGLSLAALSFGHNNQYKHPLNASLAVLVNQGWAIGYVHAGLDERRTTVRPGGIGGTDLGHIRLNWSGGSGPAHGCTCGCTLSPTQ
jgi:hypothetical protein